MTCPKCEAEMTDFRSQKAAGTKPPKFPDWKCESCGHPIWVRTKGERPVVPRAPASTVPTPQGPVTAGRVPKWTWPELSDTYHQSLLIARKQVVAMATALKLEYTTADLLSAAATVFIAAS